jgi:hypothetical protein
MDSCDGKADVSESFLWARTAAQNVTVMRQTLIFLITVPPENFRLEAIEQMSFPSSFAEVALSSAVLHFRSLRR